MLKRKIYDQLNNWKSEKHKKALVVQGARQIGKTFAIREFAKSRYDEVLEINFKETPSAAEIFSGDLNVDAMVLAMKFRYPALEIAPARTLIFLDEIQECPEAVTSLKFWTDDARYDVIASGSLLGIDYNRASSYPVGYVDYLRMYGLDFEEFLWAQEISNSSISTLRELYDSRAVIPEPIHNNMLKRLRQYAALGGMPEVVQGFVSTGDFRAADTIQRAILQGYQYDIAHYASPDEKVKAEKCYLSLGSQLLDKENHKFQYKEVEQGGRGQKYLSSIEWLLRADIISLCRAVTDIRYDLSDYARDDFFRAYTSDLSLLAAMRDFSLKQHIVEDTLSGTTRGGLYECIAADMLIKRGYDIYFYKNETNKRELDFIIQKDGEVIPIEVKSGSSKAVTLNKIVSERKDIKTAYKLTTGNMGEQNDGILSMPIYMAMFL